MSGTSGSQPAVTKREYKLEGGPKLIICKGSIPDWPKLQQERPDKLTPIAVVNAANQRLCGGGGVDGMIHSKAGPELAKECLSKPEVRPGIRCATGDAVATKGYNFNVDHIIHTCGPVYARERHQECEEALKLAYRNSLLKAQELEVQCVAFAAISTGVYAYPFKDATKVSLSVLKDAEPPLKEVWVVLFTDGDFSTATELANELDLTPYVPPPPAESSPAQVQEIR